MTRSFWIAAWPIMAAAALNIPAFAGVNPGAGCGQSSSGSAVRSPKELHSHDGRLSLDLSMRSSRDVNGQMLYCYVDAGGERSPTLRVRPGDLLILRLKNELSASAAGPHSEHDISMSPCGGGGMAADATNLHFHGLAIPPLCHQDDSLDTLVGARSPAFEYRFRIPQDQPPGLYWYHPHPHGHSEEQVLGGASGALIVEGLQQSSTLLRGLPERVLVIRDQKVPDSRDNQLDPARPAKDLSINFVPVPYPEYPPALIQTAPEKRELWRVLNAAADTYLDLFVTFGGKTQRLGLVAIDGSAISRARKSADSVTWRDDIAIPPGGRAEFILQTPPEGVKSELLTAGVDTAPAADADRVISATAGVAGETTPDDDDYTPPRPLAEIIATKATREPLTSRASRARANARSRSPLPPLAATRPVRQRTLYFSEKVMDPKHPATSTVFLLTEEGQIPAPFDPSAAKPNITVHVGDVEDWMIENRSLESHDFHIHQTHFLVLERDGKPADGYFRDTVDVPFWDGISARYPSVKLRMDFRDPSIAGIFPYHCHILQHADGGMMGIIRVEP